MSANKTFDQCNEYLTNHNLKDDFINSLIMQRKKKGLLSPKQMGILRSKVELHEKISTFFETHPELSEFQQSLKKQFEQKGFLSEKQMYYLKTEEE